MNGNDIPGDLASGNDTIPSSEAPEERRQLAEEFIAVATSVLEQRGLHEASSLVLKHALSQTGSEYGFLSLAVEGPVERLLVTEGFKWHDTNNRAFYERAMQSFGDLGYLDFRNLDNLAGRAITHKEVVLSNSPSTDPRASGIPPGHPPMHSYLGVPMMIGDEVVAVIGLANRAGGYGSKHRDEVEMLAPVCRAIANYYQQSRAGEKGPVSVKAS